MRRVIGAAFVSLDGVMQAPGGPEEDRSGDFPYGGWLAPIGDEGLNSQIETLFGQPFDLLLGRRTYEIFAAYWPFIPDDDPISAAFRDVRKYVLTRDGVDLTWQGSERLEGLDDLARLKESEGPNLVIQGSASLYPQLIQRGLIDRLVLMTAPIVLGRGRRLFGEGTPARGWRLVEHRVTANGFAMGTYEPAGSVETGSFGADNPSPAELERRERVAQGTW
jgi:dihydrofolate reductase